MFCRFQLWVCLILLWIATQPIVRSDEPAAKKSITFETVYGPQAKLKPFGHPVPRYTWLPDGEHLLRRRQGQSAKIHAATGEESPLYDPAALAASLEKLPNIDSAQAKKLAKLPGRTFNPSHDAALFSYANDLYVCRLADNIARRLTNSPAEEELAAFSPDGNYAAYVRENDLYVADLAAQTERRVTTDGSDVIRNGNADWVYYEELFDREYRAFWFSGDGNRIAFLRFDDTPVGEFIIPNNAGVTQKIERTRYPQAGTDNPLVTVGVAGVEGSSVQWVDLSAYPAQDRLIVRVGWLPDHQSLYLYVQNRIQTWLDILLLKPGTAVPERLLRQTTSAWVNPPDPPRFLQDGSFLLTDEATGWRHISRYAACGNLLVIVPKRFPLAAHFTICGLWKSFGDNHQRRMGGRRNPTCR